MRVRDAAGNYGYGYFRYLTGVLGFGARPAPVTGPSRPRRIMQAMSSSQLFAGRHVS
ncbi:MAG: hypothetical protein HS111_03160 [Kofleriaceae bacterium]|nr:hypothetical protein [Kofleriaceae bacterium]